VSVALLEARDLRVVRAGDDGPVAVLDGIDLTLAHGEVLDVSGPSGAGKTTLLRALALMLPNAEGALLLGGVSADEVGSGVWRTKVALLPQQAVIFGGTVRDNLLAPWRLKVRHGATPPDDAALGSALESVGLAEVALDRDAARLSVGQAARIALLRVGLTRPDVLLLDEPDANLDEVSAAQVTAMTARFVDGGGGVIRVRHHRPDAIAARCVRLVAGVLGEVGDGR
jgi:putative ABC transport system ATP-binding protein